MCSSGLVVRFPSHDMSGYRKNIEKKYHDQTYSGSSIETQTGPEGGSTNNGYMYISNVWKPYNFANTTGSFTTFSNDMNKGLDTGTTARTRIGNKIKPIYYKGAFTFNAAMVSPSAQDQGGEVFASSTAVGNYLRTTYRMAIVKDLQVNSSDAQVKWSQVFDTNSTTAAGVHSELNVDNMGRFIVLEDKVFTLDAESPQKTVPFMVSGSKVGSVRYNGPGASALTDKGLYVVYAAFVVEVLKNAPAKK